MIEAFATILVVVASIGVVIAVFAKNKGPEFEIFFQKFKKGIFFLLLADFFTFAINKRFKFYNSLFFCRYLVPDFVKLTSKVKQYRLDTLYNYAIFTIQHVIFGIK